MNFKSLLIVILVLAVVNISALYFLRGNNPGAKNSPLNRSQNLGSNNISLPTNPSESGVDSIKILYSFRGQLSEIKSDPKTQIISLKLNIVNPDFPQFSVVAGRTIVVKTTKDGKVDKANVDDLKVGQNVVLSDSYDPRTKTWELQVIDIIQ